ncbi:MAG: trypsin-like peptidase domain-containing protein, partial [Abditibacteriales bacterium]|nr:trypsin-like peptidase domain-containing protein [Abditibacteriales bacterium]MDW8368046.1 trypsin-like peptidase domain-containing protein [Abditibacteriales bacterium]
MKKDRARHIGRWLVVIVLFASVSAVSAYLVVKWQHPHAPMFSVSEASPPSLAGLEAAFHSVAQRLQPSVVTVATRGKPRMFSSLQDMFRDSPEPSQPEERKRLEDIHRRLLLGVGSGLIVRKDGYILTNAHVVKDAEQVDVTLNDGTVLKAKIVGQEPRADIAVLKVDAKRDLPAATLGDSDKVKVGQFAIAIGNPVNLKGTVSVGVVSGLNRSLGKLISLIQTDVAITSGSSGGPLCNLQGEVIGINTMITRESVGLGLGVVPFEGGVTGYGFAIPINVAQRVMNDLLTKGKISYGYLGVEMDSLPAEEAAEANVKKGVVVRRVQPGFAAEKAGLKAGDIITHVDGKEIEGMEAMQREIRSRRAGDKVTLTLIRDKRQLQLVVQLSELPDLDEPLPQRPEPPKPKTKPESNEGKPLRESGRAPDEDAAPPTPKPHIKLHEWRGIRVQELDPEARDYLKLPQSETGVFITGVEHDSPGYKAGLEDGDV